MPKTRNMVLVDQILMKNCRLCHSKPGLHPFISDKKLIKDIYDCIKIKINDKSMDLLPPSICDECKKTIKSFLAFKQQIQKVDQCLRKILKTGEEQYKCDQCPAEFNDQEVFKKHLNSHSTNLVEENFTITVPCSTCKAVFDNLEEYGYHQCSNNLPQKEDSDDDLQIENTEMHKDHNFDLEDTANKNSEPQNGKTPKNAKFICSYKNCRKILSSAYTLKTHHLKHQGKRSFLCVTCGKGFITKNSLTCHEKIHLDVKGYVCKLCNIGFSVRSNLRAHEKKHHEGVRFYCSQCTKAFSSKCSLERHERIHTGIKDFKCQSCPSAFYTRKELLKHQRYHQGLRLHKCDECFKTFFERHHLIIHLRSHTGERPYVCKFPNCGKSFTESQKLKRHHNAKHAQM